MVMPTFAICRKRKEVDLRPLCSALLELVSGGSHVFAKMKWWVGRKNFSLFFPKRTKLCCAQQPMCVEFTYKLIVYDYRYASLSSRGRGASQQKNRSKRQSSRRTASSVPIALSSFTL